MMRLYKIELGGFQNFDGGFLVGVSQSRIYSKTFDHHICDIVLKYATQDSFVSRKIEMRRVVTQFK